MKPISIRFEDETYSQMKDYTESSGMSIQAFVTLSIKEKLNRIELEQELKDQDLLDK
jgi:hypothetical protein